MTDYFIQDSTLTAIGNAIRKKEGSTDAILVSDMASRIEAIEFGGIDTSDATASADDIANGKTAYVDGAKLTGTHVCSSGIDTSDATATENDIISGKTAYINGEKITGVHICSDSIDTSDATATASDIAEGITAYVNGEKITGTVPVRREEDNPYWNNATPNFDADSNQLTMSRVMNDNNDSSHKLLRYGTTITLKSLASNFGDATAADVAAGKTFTSSAGLKVTGTMESSSSTGEWEKVRFILDGGGQASLSTNIYGGNCFYIDFASPISEFTGLSFAYGYEGDYGDESYCTFVMPSYNEEGYWGLYHNYDEGDYDDNDECIYGTYGDAIFDYAITATLTSTKKRIKVEMNAIGDCLADAGSEHYGNGTVFVKYA